MIKKEDLEKQLNPDTLQALWELINSEVAPQHQPKAYKAGWSAERAEQQRQRIKDTKPYLFSAGARTNLSKKIAPRNLKKTGLYSSTLQKSNLEYVDISVAPADIQLSEEINYTAKQDNEDETKG